MKVYVSAKCSDKARVKNVYALLQSAGHTITHDWTNKPDLYFVDQEFTRACALEDINAVIDADVFILLTLSEPSMGFSTELGAALVSHLLLKKSVIYIVGPYFDTNAYFFHPATRRVETIEDVLEDINFL